MPECHRSDPCECSSLSPQTLIPLEQGSCPHHQHWGCSGPSNPDAWAGVGAGGSGVLGSGVWWQGQGGSVGVLAAPPHWRQVMRYWG